MGATRKHGGDSMDCKQKKLLTLFSYVKSSVGMLFPSCSCVKALACFFENFVLSMSVESCGTLSAG